MALTAVAASAIVGIDVGQMMPTPVPRWFQPLSQWIAHALLVFGAALLSLLLWGRVLGVAGELRARRGLRLGLASLVLGAGFVVQLAMAGGTDSTLLPASWTGFLASLSLVLQVCGAVALALALGLGGRRRAPLAEDLK